ncbi:MULTISPECIES: phage tail protein [Lysinibacillus]|uniref:phage tail protein n=1 Tax=Lysinibacillus TaxID=400634 RepID=UPI00258A8D5E|nr:MULTISPECIES: tail fiber protein [Lysinibacillus]
MAEPFLAEIRLFSFGRVPKGWAQCNGQMLNVSQNQALFALIGNVYGGDGKSTFALPDLRGRVPIQMDYGLNVGQAGGAESHSLTISEIPPHTHQVVGGTNATAATPVGNVWGLSNVKAYSPTPNSQMSQSSLEVSGKSQAHSNMQPYLVLNYCIATTGYWPPRQ